MRLQFLKELVLIMMKICWLPNIALNEKLILNYSKINPSFGREIVLDLFKMADVEATDDLVTACVIDIR